MSISMSTFSLLQLSAVKHRLYGSSFGLVIVTGWSSYLTSGREAEFTLLDMDDKQGWTLTPAIAADTREMVMRIPAASVGHRLEVTVRLVQKCPVDSAMETYTHWEVVERSSCLAFEAPPPPDVLAYSYELLSILDSHTVSNCKRVIRDGLPQIQVCYQHGPIAPSDATVLMTSSVHLLHLDRWRITVAEEEEEESAGITEHIFVVCKGGEIQQRFEIPSNILEFGVGYKVAVEGLTDDPEGSNGYSRLVCKNCSLLQLPKFHGEFGRFRIEIQRDSFWQAAVTIYNNLRSYASPRTISITKLSRSKSRSSWTMACHRRSWLFMAPFGLSPQKFEFPLHFSPGDVYEVTVSDQSTDSSYRRIAHFRAELTSNDISQLHEMALRYNPWQGKEYHRLCRWIYRNKTPQYFDDIRRTDGIMRVYDKNSGGDPGCPINHRIKGLFFTATVNYGSTSGDPICVSPFGSNRLMVPVEELLEKAPNLYFADFCCKGRPHHYVTLVMTRTGSEADKFCADRLLSLSVHDRTRNPFFFYDANLRQYRVTARWYFLVELFFTEDLDIKPYEVVENVPTFGLGTSLPDGIVNSLRRRDKVYSMAVYGSSFFSNMSTNETIYENNIKRLKSLSLYSKACAFVGDTWDEGHAPFRWLYRNKSYEYFRDIRERNGGIMTVTPKDNGGDQDCPINGGRLSGLFFTASVSYSGEPLPMSPFGPCRLLVPAEELLGPSYHLYFADFYCMPYSDYHYVTLVVTVPYSEADDFCTTHLPLLDIEDNPFLFINDYNAYLRVTTEDHLLQKIWISVNIR